MKNYIELLKIARKMRSDRHTALAATHDAPTEDDRELKLLNLLVRTAMRLVEAVEIPKLSAAPNSVRYGWHAGAPLAAPYGWVIVPEGEEIQPDETVCNFYVAESSNGGGWSAPWKWTEGVAEVCGNSLAVARRVQS